jgi:hypothetical protein
MDAVRRLPYFEIFRVKDSTRIDPAAADVARPINAS